MDRPIRSNPFEYSGQPNGLDSTKSFKRRSVLMIEELSPATDRSVELAPSPIKFKLFGILLLLSLAILAIRSFHLQIVQGAERLDQAEYNRIRLERIPAMRGLILDRKGQPLVENIPNFIITATPNGLPKSETERLELLQKLADLIERPQAELLGEYSQFDLRSNRPIPIAELLNETQALKIITSLEAWPGINIEIDSIRSYSSGNNFSHLLEYVGKVSANDLQQHPDFSRLDLVGKTGLEAYYDYKLRGRNGYREVERDQLNRENV